MRVSVLCSLTVVAILAAAAGAAPSLNDPRLTLTRYVDGLSQPTGFRFIGPEDIFAIEKSSGRVRRIQNGVVTSTVLDLDVNSHSERGLLGIAIHPQFSSNNFVYLYYSATDDDQDSSSSVSWTENRLSRFTFDGSALVSKQVLLSFPRLPFPNLNGPNHDGGPLLFGPGGKLYGTTGDLNRNGAEQNNQSESNSSAGVGGIFRLNAPGDATDGSMPGDNPFATHANSDFHLWYAYGVRNTFGMAFDPLTDQLWSTENGPNLYDEINLVPKGFNSGWRKIMGPDSRDTQDVDDLVTLPNSVYSDPEFSWFFTIGVTSIQFLAESLLGPSFRDSLLVGDDNSGRLYRFEMNAARDGLVFNDAALADLVADTTAERNLLTWGTGFGTVTGIEIGPFDSAVYVMSLSRGEIHRILPEPTVWAVSMCVMLLAATRTRRSYRSVS